MEKIILAGLLIFLFIIHNYFVITSYNKKIFIGYWHKSQFLIIILIGILGFGFTTNVIKFYLTYYIFFEPILNKLRKKSLTYLSTNKKVWLDALRLKIFGKYTKYTEIIFRIIAIIILILLINK